MFTSFLQWLFWIGGWLLTQLCVMGGPSTNKSFELLCWSRNLSGTGGQQVEWRFMNIEEIFWIGLLNQTTSPLQQSLNKLLSNSSVNQTLKYLNLASNDLHGNVAVLQRLSNIIEL
jgi:hypothetical protein